MNTCCEHCSQASEDHDLLIRIDQRLSSFTDHEQRIRKVEKWASMAIGGLFIVQLIMGLFFTLAFRK